MTKYVQATDGVIDLVSFEAPEDLTGWIEAPDWISAGDLYDGTIFTTPPIPLAPRDVMAEYERRAELVVGHSPRSEDFILACMHALASGDTVAINNVSEVWRLKQKCNDLLALETIPNDYTDDFHWQATPV